MLFAATERELAGLHAALTAGMENGTLRPVVGQEMPLRMPRARTKRCWRRAPMGKSCSSRDQDYRGWVTVDSGTGLAVTDRVWGAA